MKKCENCNQEHDGNYGSGRFCCKKCARSFSTKAKRKEINQKVSKKLKDRAKNNLPKDTSWQVEINCEWCDKLFIKRQKNQRFCSQKCSRTRNWKLRTLAAHKANQKLIKEGKYVGWQSRAILSYPEKFFKKVLINNKLFDKCIVNYPIKKKYLGINQTNCYFLDFYFPELKLDLEIDGKQHKYSEREKSDIVRDKLLTNNNIKVYRIEWKNINNKSGSEYITKEIDKFLEFYSKLINGYVV